MSEAGNNAKYFLIGAGFGAALVVAAMLFCSVATTSLPSPADEALKRNKDIPSPDKANGGINVENSLDAGCFRTTLDTKTALDANTSAPVILPASSPSTASQTSANMPEPVIYRPTIWDALMLAFCSPHGIQPVTPSIEQAPPVAAPRTAPTSTPALIPGPKSTASIPDFAHTEDFLTVYKNGVKHELTTNESRVAQYYFEKHESGTPEVNQSKTLEELSIGCKRIKDVFKNHEAAFKALFVRGERKGSYRLNIA